MNSERPGRPIGVIGPTGKPLTVNNLPPAGTKRWGFRRKAEVVAAVNNGLIDLEEACERYRLSVEEFLNWQQLFEAHGMRGLRVTRLQEYRPSEHEDVVAPAPERTRMATAKLQNRRSSPPRSYGGRSTSTRSGLHMELSGRKTGSRKS